MSSIDLFYQMEGVREIQHLDVEPETTIASIIATLSKQHGLPAEGLLVFLEDGDEPLNHADHIKHHAGPAGVKLHLHRCRHVEVVVTFNRKTVERSFRPSATVARAKHWAARKFGMTDEEAGEHVLQIAGTHDRPPVGVHLGSLAACTHCKLAFDLVPDERINGASETA